ncbi:hypothetical protein ACUN7V_03430 [Quadrisphaera oryzae]|uniref:hypothetical protein n=1 Tax=Quadrisphaera TaxID=317661 RepID=UPI00164805A1|nr:hypothetical protein [Quadrisphaera sp. RL12-1S]MBC3761919.1 hypothetical protein [Quadrisphaera sp. RL12-1S]
MARIRVSDGQLEVRLTGLDALWSLRRRLVVPLSAVRGATADPGAAAEPKGVRAPGLHLPGVAAVGTFHRGGDKTLYAVHSGRRTVVVQLEPGADTAGFARAVVEVPDPRAAVDDVNRALSQR